MLCNKLQGEACSHSAARCVSHCQRNCIEKEQCSPHGSYQLFDKLILFNTSQLHSIYFHAQSTQIQAQGCDWRLPDFIHFIDAVRWQALLMAEIWTLVFQRCHKLHSIHKTFSTLLLCAVAGWQDMPADKSALLDLLPSISSAKATNQKPFLNKTSIPGSQH